MLFIVNDRVWAVSESRVRRWKEDGKEVAPLRVTRDGKLYAQCFRDGWYLMNNGQKYTKLDDSWFRNVRVVDHPFDPAELDD